MAARPPQRDGAGWFTTPGQVNHRRYEALRAFFVDGLTYQQAADRTPLNRTSVAEILAEEGFGRLLRGPAEQTSSSSATPGRDTRLPRAAVLDFGAWPRQLDTTRAGLLLVLPDLVALDLAGLVRRAGYLSTRVIPATSWLLSLLALKLTRTRRVSHVDDLLVDPAAGLLAGLGTLPKKSALTSYSYRLSHNHQRAFLAALDQNMIAAELATGEQAIFDLDFHAVLHWGDDPVLEKHYVPTRSQRARSVLTFFAQDTGTHNLVYANADISKATQAREPIAFCDHWKAVSGHDPHLLVMDQKVTTQKVLGELDARGVKFLTLRMRSPALVKQINALTSKDFTTVTLDRPGKHSRPGVHESTVTLTSYPGTLRQLIVTGLGHDTPTVIITNHHQASLKTLIERYARRMTIDPRLSLRRALQHRQPQRRPGRHARRAGPGPAGRPARAAARLPQRHPRHPPAPLPRDPRPDHHRWRHRHRPPRTTRLRTRPAPGRPTVGHHRPLVGQPHPALRVRLNLAPNQLRGNPR